METSIKKNLHNNNKIPQDNRDNNNNQAENIVKKVKQYSDNRYREYDIGNKNKDRDNNRYKTTVERKPLDQNNHNLKFQIEMKEIGDFNTLHLEGIFSHHKAMKNKWI